MSDDEDDYVAFGVALKPLEAGDTIRKKPIAVEEQIVRDVNGIRRFHGAFTGGFSAGHFNTVNTPQGWYPKQFKSTREKKEDRKQQRPEDFMDDEDLGEFGFAAQALKTKSNFQRGAGGADQDDGGRLALGTSRRVEGVLNAGGFMDQLVRPASSSLGERLLTRQGWRPGQGIGPKITKESKQARMASHARTYGCSGPGGRGAEDKEEDPFMEKYKEFLFAPDEIPLYEARPKENLFGIGYSGLGQSEEARHAMMPMLAGGGSRGVRTSLKTGGASKKFSISGEAFGIGADEENDDMDVYNHGDMAQYDFSLDLVGEERRERREAKGSRWGDEGKDRGMDKENIAGFSPASAKSMIKKHFPSERPPHDWRPKRNPGQRRQSRFSPAVTDPGVPPSRKSRWDETGPGKSNNTNPTVDQRRSKLFPDECNTPKPSTSASGVKQESEEDSKPPTLPEFLQNFKPGSGDGLASFKPFARNADKQNRYEQYLVCVQNNRRDALSLLQPKTMTDWEKEREKVEFERASMLFKPMKGVIGSRFVSAGGSEAADEDSKELSPEAEAEQSLRKAADMKMFGKLTRTSEDWHPARLVCVRFNVPHPYGDYNTVGTKGKGAKKDTGVKNVFAMLENDPESSKEKPKQTSQKQESGEQENPESSEEAKIEVENIKQEEDEVTEKPPADLFKAIFLDSESESEDDDDNGQTESAPAPPPVPAINPAVSGPKPWQEKEGNILRNKEPARGIFANIDLDSLNRRGPSSNNTLAEEERKNRSTESRQEKPVAKGSTGNISVANQTLRTVLGIRNEPRDSSSDDEYGPRLPDSMLPAPAPTSIVISSDSEDDDVVNKKHKKGKKSKKGKKHKEKKKRKDIKKKKKRVTRSESSSSSSSRSRSRSRDHKHKKRKRSYSRHS